MFMFCLPAIVFLLFVPLISCLCMCTTDVRQLSKNILFALTKNPLNCLMSKILPKIGDIKGKGNLEEQGHWKHGYVKV